jgi:hypothetical protein
MNGTVLGKKIHQGSAVLAILPNVPRHCGLGLLLQLLS